MVAVQLGTLAIAASSAVAAATQARADGWLAHAANKQTSKQTNKRRHNRARARAQPDTRHSRTRARSLAGLTPATSAPGLGSPRHVCTGTGLAADPKRAPSRRVPGRLIWALRCLSAAQVASSGLSAAFTAVTAVRVGYHLGRGDLAAAKGAVKLAVSASVRTRVYTGWRAGGRAGGLAGWRVGGRANLRADMRMLRGRGVRCTARGGCD